MILHKLLCNQPLTEAEQQGVRSVEFSEGYQRVYKLIIEDRIDKNKYQFIVDAKEWIDQLNTIRNRIWHRGAYILRYPALDALVGRYILPFVQVVLQLPAYSRMEKLWQYRILACGVDPINSIIQVCRDDSSFDIKHLAFLKEMGRAAYENPYYPEEFGMDLNDEIRKRIERGARSELPDANISDVLNCPVCGTKSLIVFNDIETEGENMEQGTYEKAWRYTWQVECRCCSFLVNNYLDNPSLYGLPLPDYWNIDSL